jgi:hypothetical protein
MIPDYKNSGMIWRLFYRRKTAQWMAENYPPRGESAEIYCLDCGAGLYSPPSQASPVINQSQFSPAVRRGAYANSADIDYWSERRKGVP